MGLVWPMSDLGWDKLMVKFFSRFLFNMPNSVQPRTLVYRVSPLDWGKVDNSISVISQHVFSEIFFCQFTLIDKWNHTHYYTVIPIFELRSPHSFAGEITNTTNGGGVRELFEWTWHYNYYLCYHIKTHAPAFVWELFELKGL